VVEWDGVDGTKRGILGIDGVWHLTASKL
jgi:hypothetical protein